MFANTLNIKPNFSRKTRLYRYSFNGKESDREASDLGEGTQDYGFRIYNPSLGKFLSVDPLARSFSMLSSYQYASNMPVAAIDLDGAESVVVTHYIKENEKGELQVWSETTLLNIPGPLGSGVLETQIYLTTGAFSAKYNEQVVEIIAKKTTHSCGCAGNGDIWNMVEGFFNPKLGFEFTSEDGSLSSARFGTGEKIEDMEMLISALGGMKTALEMKGNPILKDGSIGAEELDKTLDFQIERVTGIFESAMEAIKAGKTVEQFTDKKADYIMRTVTSSESSSSTHDTEFNQISQDSLQTLKKKYEKTTSKNGTKASTQFIEKK